MAKSNYHTHTFYSDGKSNFEDYVLIALSKKMESIGFSDHVPIPIANDWSMQAAKLENYFAEIAKLKQKYQNQIEIYAGLEMDYLKTADQNQIRKYISQADYTIGSVHYLYDEKHDQYFSAENSMQEAEIAFKKNFNGNSQACVRDYYLEMMRVISEFRPTIVGHLDIIKRQNKDNIYFNEHEDWYIELIKMVLDVIASLGTIIEINNGSMIYNSLQDTYPSNWIIQEVYQRKIPIILTSDAHEAKDIDGLFIETTKKLRAIGFTQQKILKSGTWVDVGL